MDFEEKNMFKMIKTAGYKVSKDTMGTYFDNADRKFSIIRTGDIYNCYLNKKVNGGFILKDQLNGQIMLKTCLYWVVNNMMKKLD